jgi:hypothetical protein
MSVPEAVCAQFLSAVSSDSGLIELIDKLPSLDFLASLIGESDPTDVVVLKLLLDVYEAALLRFDGPGFHTYADYFLPMTIEFYRRTPVLIRPDQFPTNVHHLVILCDTR